MNRGTITAVATILILTGYACSSREGSVVEYTTEDGVKVILTRCDPPFPEPWRFSSEHIAGIAYGDTSYMFRNPWEVTVLEGGEWVVLDSQPLEFRIYSQDGAFIRSFGRGGRGPTDLRWSYTIGRLIPVGPDRFDFWCDWPAVIQTWDLEGHLVQSRSMGMEHPLVQGRSPRRLKTIGNRLYALVSSWRLTDVHETIGHSYIISSDWAGSFIDTLYTIEHTPMSTWESAARAAFDYPPSDVVLTTTAGRLYVSSWEEDWIHELDPFTGKEKLRFRLEHEPMTIPQHQIDRMREQLDADIAEGLMWLRERAWFLDMYEGPRNEIWVQRRGEPLEDGTWPEDVFTSDGEYRGRMFFRDQFPRGDNWNDLELLTVGSTEEGAPALVRYTFIPNL